MSFVTFRIKYGLGLGNSSLTEEMEDKKNNAFQSDSKVRHLGVGKIVEETVLSLSKQITLAMP